MESRPILYASLDDKNPESSIQEAIDEYLKKHNSIRHVWVNPLDVAGQLVVRGYTVERKGGCARKKVMVF